MIRYFFIYLQYIKNGIIGNDSVFFYISTIYKKCVG